LLRPLLADAYLKECKQGNKRWNAEIILRSLLILCGWHSAEARLRYKLPAEWEELLIIADAHGVRRDIAAFLRYAHRRGLMIHEVGSQTLLDYVEWLTEWTLDPDPWGNALVVARA
jgi:hypothetical protein